MDEQLNQLIFKSVIPEEFVDISETLGLEDPDISILSDGFLEDVRALSHKNLVKARKFSEMLKNEVNQYNKRTIETSRVIKELIELVKKMNESLLNRGS